MISLRILSLLAVVLAVTHAASEEPKPKDEYIPTLRKELGVYAFTSHDYPAAFAIIAGVSIILAVAVIFIVVGMLSADPGKDSIIYRMTTTRMKKD